MEIVMDIVVLQCVRLKGGMADATVVAEATGRQEAQVRAELEAALATEQVVERRGRYRITPAGREVLDAGLAVERAGLAAEVLAEHYEAFVGHNTTFKQLATDWQLRDGAPNDHTDPAYDVAVLAGVEAVHAAFAPVAHGIVSAVRRLSPYPGRLAGALQRVLAGDHRFLLSPVLDSYHQVWFELHEELILVGGLDRREEAAAGRAQ